MEYKEKYKNVMEVLKKAASDPKYEDERFCCVVYDLFPELKESEDEKIRKRIIHALHGDVLDMEETTKAIAWLENQGKETSWKPSKEEMDVLYGLAYITNQYDEHKEEVITRLYQDLKREFFNGSSYENMFPTNTSTEDDVRRRSTIQVLEYARSLDAYNQFGKADIDKNIAWLEKQDKQPSAIRWYDVSLIPQEMKELLVEWDSEDATWHEVAFYRADTKTFWDGTRQVENVTRWCYIIDLLEKQGEPELSEDLGEYIAELSKQFPDVSFAKLSRIAVRVKNWFEKQGKQKSAWSEEDEKNLQGIIDEIQANKNNAPSYDIPVYEGFLNWLKSLKDRVQPKQEWSERDKVKINRIVACLENLNVADNDILLKDVDWLKSLKQRIGWKPSDAQMQTLKEACDKHWEPDGLDPLYTLYEQLKKLKGE